MTIQKVNIGQAADDGQGDAIRSSFNKTNQNFEYIESELGTKANAEDLQSYTTTTALTTALAGKADKTEVEALQTAVQNKAEKSYVDAELAKKADQTALDTIKDQLQSSIDSNSQSITNLTATVQDHKTRIETLENNSGGGGEVDVAALAADGLEATTGKLKVKTGSGVVVSSSGVSVKLSQDEKGNSNSGLGFDSNKGLGILTADDSLEIDGQNGIKVSSTTQQDISSKIAKTDIATPEEIQAGTKGKVLDADGLQASIATTDDITNGTDGKLVDAQGLKTSGITKERIETIHNKGGGTLTADSQIILIKKSVDWGNGVWNSSPAFIARLDSAHEARFSSWTRPGVDAGCQISYRDNNTNTDFNFRSDGTGWCQNGWTSGSDRRLKTDIEPVQNALEKIKNLNGYTFKLNGRMGAGVIAQELVEVLPEAVSVGGDVQMRDSTLVKDALSVDYGSLSCLYIEAIKELLDRVEALELKAKS